MLTVTQQAEIRRVLGYPALGRPLSDFPTVGSMFSAYRILDPYGALETRMQTLTSYEEVQVLGAQHSAFSSSYLLASFGLPLGSSGGAVVYQFTENDRSGSIAAGGVGQAIMAANNSRSGWTLQNTSTSQLRFSDSGSMAGASSYMLGPGERFSPPATGVSYSPISVYGAVTGQTFSAVEAYAAPAGGANSLNVGATCTLSINDFNGSATATSGETMFSMAAKIVKALAGNGYVSASSVLSTITLYANAIGDAGNGTQIIAMSNDSSLLFGGLSLSVGATSGGANPPGPVLMDDSLAAPVIGYLPIIKLLKSDLFGSRQDLRFSKADVVTYRTTELRERNHLLQNARQELADFLAVPLEPDSLKQRGSRGRVR